MVIRDKLGNRSDSAVRFLWGPTASISLKALEHGTSLGGGLRALSGRSVLLTTRDPMSAALAFIELDGVAARLIICPADTPKERLRPVIDTAAVDGIVADFDPVGHSDLAEILWVMSSSAIKPMNDETLERYDT